MIKCHIYLFNILVIIKTVSCSGCCGALFDTWLCSFSYVWSYHRESLSILSCVWLDCAGTIWELRRYRLNRVLEQTAPQILLRQFVSKAAYARTWPMLLWLIIIRNLRDGIKISIQLHLIVHGIDGIREHKAEYLLEGYLVEGHFLLAIWLSIIGFRLKLFWTIVLRRCGVFNIIWIDAWNWITVLAINTIDFGITHLVRSASLSSICLPVRATRTWRFSLEFFVFLKQVWFAAAVGWPHITILA